MPNPNQIGGEDSLTPNSPTLHQRPTAGISYNELLENIRSLPMTWCPAILEAVVERCCTADVYLPGALERVVAEIVAKSNA